MHEKKKKKEYYINYYLSVTHCQFATKQRSKHNGIAHHPLNFSHMTLVRIKRKSNQNTKYGLIDKTCNMSTRKLYTMPCIFQIIIENSNWSVLDYVKVALTY